MPKSESFVRIPTRCDLDCLALTSRFELFSFRHQNKNEKSNKSDNIGELQKKRLKKQTGGRIVSGEALHLNEENQASKNPQAELKDKTSHGCSCHGDRLIEPVNSPEKVLKLNEPTKCRNEFRMAGKKDSSAFHKRIRINRKLVSLFECVIVITWFSLAAAQKRILSLNGAEWTFQNSNQSK